jgi:hypothetical protein
MKLRDTNTLREEERMNTEYVVKVSKAAMPSSCWGRYVHVAVMEVEKGTFPTMISERARGVVRIIYVSRNLFEGSSNRCAAAKAIAAAEKFCDEQNAALGVCA